MSQELCCILSSHGYKMVRFIESGAFGSCYVVHSLKYNMDFVCKVSYVDEVSKRYITSFVGEAEILSKLNHPNIVRIYDYFLDENQMFLILEYCTNGSLYDIMKAKKRIPNAKIIKYASEIINALAFMHEKGIAHCDIKLSNILIDEYDRVKICDFGLSRYSQDRIERSKRVRGTINYMAPEIICGLEYSTFKADVWALGVTLFALITNCFPFGEKDPRFILSDMQKGYTKVPSNNPLSFIIDDCLCMDQNNRPTIEQIKNKMDKLFDATMFPKQYSCDRILIPKIRRPSIHVLRVSRGSCPFA